MCYNLIIGFLISTNKKYIEKEEEKKDEKVFQRKP